MSATQQFNRFVGKEIAVTPMSFKNRIFGNILGSYNPTVDENDGVIADLKAAAQNAGFTVRVWLPNMIAPEEDEPNRLNVHVKKETDGKYRIQSGFHLG